VKYEKEQSRAIRSIVTAKHPLHGFIDCAETAVQRYWPKMGGDADARTARDVYRDFGAGAFGRLHTSPMRGWIAATVAAATTRTDPTAPRLVR
jgi:hypothetical protein